LNRREPRGAIREIANGDGKKEWDYRRKQRVVLLGKKAKEAGEEKQLLFFPP
jgi:hypothetical protein